MIEEIKPLLGKLTSFAKDRLGFTEPPRLFLRKDLKNGSSILGKTAHYDPANKAITIFVSNRHPKDILRSYCHELVHHCQNIRGDLSPEKMKTINNNYAQENEHMRKMEEEAYLQGNMCFRDWEDGLDNKLKYKIHLAEQSYLKENKDMSVKINKKDLKNLIGKLLSERVKKYSKDSAEPIEEIEDLEEGGCGSHGKREDKVCPKCGHRGGLHEDNCSENSEIAVEEAKGEKGDADPLDGEREKFDKDLDGNPDGGDPDPDDPEVNESKIQTPEQENTLYESRFTQRNNKLFEKLLNQWTK